MALIGDLVVRMSADIANITTSIGKAEQQFRSFRSNANRILGTIGVGVGVGAFASFIKSTVDAADNLNDLRTRTGLAGQELLVLQGAALRSGGDLSTLDSVAGKLVKRMAEARRGVGDAAEAFEAMGINVERADGSLKNQGEILREVGQKFRQYEDGADKADLAIAALGKGGDRLIPVVEAIKETEERFKRLGITISEDLISAADRFNDTASDINSLLGVLGRQTLAVLLPYMQNLADLMVDVAKDSAAANDALSGTKLIIDAIILPVKVLATGFITLGASFAAAAEDLVGFGLAIGTFVTKRATALGDFLSAVGNLEPVKAIDAAQRLHSLDFSDELDAIRTGNERAAKRFQGAVDLVSNIWKDRPPAPDLVGPPESARRRQPAPKRADKTAAKGAEDALRQLLDQQSKIELDAIKTLEKQKTELLNIARQHFIVDETEYWQQYMQIQAGAYQAELDALRKQKARQDAELKKAKPGTKEYYNAQKDVEQTQAAINKLTVEFGTAAAKATADAAKSMRDYARGIEEVQVEILSLQGREAEAAAMRAKLDGEEFRKKYQNDPTALAARDQLDKLRIGQAEYNQLRERQGEIVARLSIEEERIQNSLRTGAISEIEALSRTGEARARAAAQLDGIVQKLEEVARASKNPALILQAEQARHELEKLRKETDLLAQKFDTIFKDAFTDAFASFLDGTKSAKEAFNDFAKSVISSINKLVSEALAKKLFEAIGLGGDGKGGASPLGTALAKIFGVGVTPTVPGSVKPGVGVLQGPTQDGGNLSDSALGKIFNTTATSASAVDASMAALAASVTTSDAALATMAASVTTSDAALGALSVTTPMVDSALAALAAAAEAAAAALATISTSGAASSGGGAFGALGGLFGGGIGYGSAGTEAATALVSTIGGGFVPALASGTDYVKKDGLAYLHKGEQVLTAAQVEAGGSRGGAVTVNQQFVISAPIDRRSQAQVMAAGGAGVQRVLVRDT
jgi:hypothetical protein